MRFARFLSNGTARCGLIVEGDWLRPLPAHITSLQTYLALPESERDALPTEDPVELQNTPLLAPVRPQKNVFCVGRNYMGHAEEVARALGKPLNLPNVPTFFTKAPTAIVDPGATIHLAADLSSEYDWEAELAVVIGKRCRDVSEEDALSVIFGYTCLNDVTARDLQRSHQQWFKGKSLDETCPIGPWIVTADEIGDPQSLDIALRIDGETKQHASTGTMIFNVRQIIASLTSGMTLEPGDVIATGTPDGVGMARKPPEFLFDGAAMEVEISKIGVLRNAVALKAHAAAR
jgi:2-keto-4-pentenoate hydratase/2-oxohepta-3-ene-1,7-dioic acid hydratase in catechol pathway